uniref:Uncharacterized protein n=1 Tax=Lepeophtheirus salmonis TaxID=72036 RepID=A0A0K2ULL5_LEPSM
MNHSSCPKMLECLLFLLLSTRLNSSRRCISFLGFIPLGLSLISSCNIFKYILLLLVITILELILSFFVDIGSTSLSSWKSPNNLIRTNYFRISPSIPDGL